MYVCAAHRPLAFVANAERLATIRDEQSLTAIEPTAAEERSRLQDLDVMNKLVNEANKAPRRASIDSEAGELSPNDSFSFSRKNGSSHGGSRRESRFEHERLKLESRLELNSDRCSRLSLSEESVIEAEIMNGSFKDAGTAGRVVRFGNLPFFSNAERPLSAVSDYLSA